ncbi:hypothetical protein D3C75_744140 [compost metagenome]
MAGVLLRQTLELLVAGGSVELVQFQPEALAGRGVQPGKLAEQLIQRLQGEQQGAGSQLPAVVVGRQLQRLAGGQLGGARQLLVQGLAQGGDLLAAGIEDHHLATQVLLQLGADEAYFRLYQLEQLQAIGGGRAQAVELLQGAVQASCGLAEIGLGQLAEPGPQGGRLRRTEGQAGQVRGGDAQQGVGGVQVHGVLVRGRRDWVGGAGVPIPGASGRHVVATRPSRQSTRSWRGLVCTASRAAFHSDSRAASRDSSGLQRCQPCSLGRTANCAQAASSVTRQLPKSPTSLPAITR